MRTFEEIAQIEHSSVDAVYATYQRGIAKLRKRPNALAELLRLARELELLRANGGERNENAASV